MRWAAWLMGGGVVLGLVPALAAATAKDLQTLFEPLQVERATLAPDGRHLAFTFRTEGHIELMLADLDDADKGMRMIVGRDTANTDTLLYRVRYARVPFLGWSSGDTLAYYVIPFGGAEPSLRAIDADGTNDRQLRWLDDVLNGGRFGVPGEFNLPDWPNMMYGITPLPATPSLPENTIPLLGLTRSRPHQVIITGRQGYSVINPVDGRAEPFSHSLLADAGPAPVFDADFNPRLALFSEASSLTVYRKFPHYRYVSFPPDPPRPRELIAPGFEFDADDVFAPHSVPLGIGTDLDLLYFASNVARDDFAVFTMDLGRKAPPQLVAESPGFDVVDPRNTPVADILVRDHERQVVGIRLAGLPSRTKWLDPELARWQERLDQAYPGFNVVIREWDDQRRRALIEVNPPSRAGAWMVVDLSGELRRLFSVDRSAFDRRLVGSTVPVSLGEPMTSALTGLLTRPPPGGAAPLVIYLRNSASPNAAGPPDAPRPDTQALAALGFAVLDLDYRGLFGFGQEHLGAGRTDADLRAIEDVRATIRAAAAWDGVDATRVALVGFGFGGYVALRAAALHPEAFRAVVTVDAPTVPDRWRADLAQKLTLNQRAIHSLGLEAGTYPDLRDAAKSIRAKVLLMQESTAIVTNGVEPAHATRLRDAIRKAGGSVEYRPLKYEFTYPNPEARAADLIKMGDFLRAAFAAR